MYGSTAYIITICECEHFNNSLIKHMVWHPFFSWVSTQTERDLKWVPHPLFSLLLPFAQWDATYGLHKKLVLLLTRLVYTENDSFRYAEIRNPRHDQTLQNARKIIFLNGRQSLKIKLRKSWKLLNREIYVPRNLYVYSMHFPTPYKPIK